MKMRRSLTPPYFGGDSKPRQALMGGRRGEPSFGLGRLAWTAHPLGVQLDPVLALQLFPKLRRAERRIRGE